jgi:hypothetical protein
MLPKLSNIVPSTKAFNFLAPCNSLRFLASGASNFCGVMRRAGEGVSGGGGREREGGKEGRREREGEREDALRS